MLFNSFEFIVFLPLFLAAYFLVPKRFQIYVTLVASFYFYMSWKPIYILLILFCAVVNYFGSMYVFQTEDLKKRKIGLWVCTILNLSVIIAFKYSNFLITSVLGLGSLFGASADVPLLDLLLPVGISFYTFHTLSYTIDVYRRETPLERDPFVVLLYVVFWPMLLAGPIERSNHLIPQLKAPHYFDKGNALVGINRIILGLFKKVVVADRLSGYVSEVYGNLDQHGPLTVAIAVFAFTIQIYCDFSGYCDIALGAARIMGFELFENFNRPYLATSISGFWDRWHMSLSRWFKDYVYIPLGGSRGVTVQRHYLNIMITFLVSGLWHGASWTFVFWGGLHGFLLVCENIIKRFKVFGSARFKEGISGSIFSFASYLFIFILINITWVFFRADSFSGAGAILSKSLDVLHWQVSTSLFVGKGPFAFLLMCLSILLLALSYLLPSSLKLKHNLAFGIVGVILIFLLGTDGSSEFIYFQF